MDEARNETLNTTLVVWATLVAALIGVKAYAQAPFFVWGAGALWLGLTMIALLAQTSAGGRDYLIGTLRTRHYTQVYRLVARRLNDWVWRRLGRARVLPTGTEAPPPETTPFSSLLRDALTWRLLDRALLIAVAYPVIALILPWLLGGDAVLGAGVVVFPAAAFWADRAAVLGLFVIMTLSFRGRKLASASPKRFWQKIANLLPIIAYAFVFSVVLVVYRSSEFADIAGLTFVLAFAFAGAFAVAIVSLFALLGVGAGAFAAAGTFAVTITLTVAVVFTAAGPLASVAGVAAAIAFDWLWRRGRQRWVLTLLLPSWALSLTAVVMLADLSSLSAERKAILFFLAILPLINGLFDALSYAITLALSRKGFATRWAPLLGLLDLALGAVLFLFLGATMIAVVAALNAIGTAPLYDLIALFAGLRASPRDYWWLYLILFSTLAPTALHILVAALAVQGWVAFKRPRRAVARWIEAAPVSHPAAVAGCLAQALIWWLPLMALAGAGCVLWQGIGSWAVAAGLVYLDALEGLARWIGAI